MFAIVWPSIAALLLGTAGVPGATRAGATLLQQRFNSDNNPAVEYVVANSRSSPHHHLEVPTSPTPQAEVTATPTEADAYSRLKNPTRTDDAYMPDVELVAGERTSPHHHMAVPAPAPAPKTEEVTGSVTPTRGASKFYSRTDDAYMPEIELNAGERTSPYHHIQVPKC